MSTSLVLLAPSAARALVRERHAAGRLSGVSSLGLSYAMQTPDAYCAEKVMTALILPVAVGAAESLKPDSISR